MKILSRVAPFGQWKILLVLAASVAARVSPAATASLTEPTVEAAKTVAAMVGDRPAILAAAWQPQTAPGSLAPPSADTRRQWLVSNGWYRVPVTSAGNAGSASVVQVPDEWP